MKVRIERPPVSISSKVVSLFVTLTQLAYHYPMILALSTFYYLMSLDFCQFCITYDLLLHTLRKAKGFLRQSFWGENSMLRQSKGKRDTNPSVYRQTRLFRLQTTNFLLHFRNFLTAPKVKIHKCMECNQAFDWLGMLHTDRS